MSKTVWRREAIESPCVNICVIHPEARLCIGCYRSMDEISGWASLPPDRRSEIMAELPDRAPRVAGRRQGGRHRTTHPLRSRLGNLFGPPSLAIVRPNL
ncbi:MAG: DUF1289 domain-containing protein, partial [Pseudomonadota bacterium]